jgi:hypothetical protein
MAISPATMNRTLAWYNMVPNLFWSVLHLLPLCIFCYYYVTLPLLFSLLAICIIAGFLPLAFFRLLQLAPSPFVYRRLGVPHLNKVTQNGTVVKGWMQKKYPQHRVLRSRKADIARLIRQTYVFEKFHFMFFLFFCGCMLLALGVGAWAWAGLLLLLNITYNVYPCLLQQYIRLKLSARAQIRQETPNT